jgi:hypothetical protein
MTKVCHGCNHPLEPLAAVRTYHAGCDPRGRAEMLERALNTIWERSLEAQIALEDGMPRGPKKILVEIADIARAALAYKPAQMKEREG